MTFQLQRSTPIPSIQSELHEYEDDVTGARHLHLDSPMPELAFLVAVPTHPDSDNGCAHVLEHMVMCGSRRFPVPDLLFAMTRRSAATMMNAMTFPDKTVYPFVTPNRRDFENLMQVYLDAVFHPLLTPAAFHQEGWRITNGEEPKLNGVVLNEMRGEHDDPARVVDLEVSRILFEGAPYGADFGGDPLRIPTLRHQDIVDCHDRFYHPSQAVFMTSGAVRATDVQSIIGERVLAEVSERRARIVPVLLAAWKEPRLARVSYPASRTGAAYGLHMAWRLGEVTNWADYFDALVMECGLIGNAEAPLARALEACDYGRPATIAGLNTMCRQMSFHIGMENLKRGSVGNARALIWDAMEQAACKGVDPRMLHAELRDIRVGHQEFANGDLPGVLARLVAALPAVMLGADPRPALDPTAEINAAQQRLTDPAHFRGMVRRLLDSNTRLEVTAVPDKEYQARREREAAAVLDQALRSGEGRDAPEERREPAGRDLLPCLRLADMRTPPPGLEIAAASGGSRIAVPILSNGISHARAFFDISDFTEDDWPWLHLYADLMPGLGLEGMTYEEASAFRHRGAADSGIGLHAGQTHRPERTVRLHLSHFVKGLRTEHDTMVEVLESGVTRARFDEIDRIEYLLDTLIEDTRMSLADNADLLAQIESGSGLSPLVRFDDYADGAAALVFQAWLARERRKRKGLCGIAERLRGLHARIVAAPLHVLTAGAQDDAQDLLNRICLASARPGFAPGATRNPRTGVTRATMFRLPTGVSHCSASWAVPGLDHPDAAGLAVLAEILTHGILHREIREKGGAYSATAGYQAAAGLFMMNTYRDPSVSTTIKHFSEAAVSLRDTLPTAEQVEEGVIAVLTDLDRPKSPFGAVMQAWDRGQQGLGRREMTSFRERLVACTPRDVTRCALTWLHEETMVRASCGPADGDTADGFEIVDLKTGG